MGSVTKGCHRECLGYIAWAWRVRGRWSERQVAWTTVKSVHGVSPKGCCTGPGSRLQ